MQVAPILLQALDTNDNGLQLATLDTVEMMVTEMPDLLQDHVSTLVPALLRLSTFKSESTNTTPGSAKVRIAAVKLLGLIAMSKIPYSVLHPLKPGALKGIGAALEDPKRVVRKEAANSRLKWYFLLGSKQD
jgi:DNA repair/transcription protein MET18/MMS19